MACTERSSPAQYGDRLLCVRYRYDPERLKRLKTIELVVAERDWYPPRPILPAEQLVALLVPFADRDVRDVVKGAGGRWDPDPKVWELRYDQVLALGLQERHRPVTPALRRDFRQASPWRCSMPASRFRCRHLPVHARHRPLDAASQSNSSSPHPAIALIGE